MAEPITREDDDFVPDPCDFLDEPTNPQQQVTSHKLDKAYLRRLDRKFERLFKKSKLSCGLSNATKSVYSFEGEVLSEEEEEYDESSQSDFTGRDEDWCRGRPMPKGSSLFNREESDEDEHDDDEQADSEEEERFDPEYQPTQLALSERDDIEEVDDTNVS